MITILQHGTLLRSPTGAILDAHSTITLIRSGGTNIIVDTGFPGDEGNIRKGLEALCLGPDDIDIVINTHTHLDHIAGNKRFTKARFYIHPLEDAGAAPSDCEVIRAEPPLNIDENVTLIFTPGHSRGCISVVVRHLPSDFSDEKETVVCAGDALPIHGNYLGWVPPGINYDWRVALDSMKRIVQIADWVVPGHDRPFRVERK